MSLEYACAFIFAVAAFYSIVHIKKPVLAIGISACLITLYMGLLESGDFRHSGAGNNRQYRSN